jgi:hypothetical protein
VVALVDIYFIQVNPLLENIQLQLAQAARHQQAITSMVHQEHKAGLDH